MRYYSTQRPLTPGAYPKSLAPTKIVNFDEKTYCEDIGREAWGYIEFLACISEEETKAWEFTMAGMKTWYCVTSSFYNNGKVTSRITDTKESVDKPESNYKELKRCDVYTDWYATKEEADAAVQEALKA